MANLNSIVLVGRLTADPEARTTLDGLPMTKFKLAVDRPVAGGGSAADMIDVVAWRKVAEISSEYLKKGSLVLVDGRIQNRTFDDQEGQRHWVTEVVARNLTLLDKSPADSTEESSAKSKMATAEADEAVADDLELAGDLPF